MSNMVAPLEVGICCGNLEQMVGFYRDILACELVSVIEVPAAKARQAAVSDSGYRVARVQLPTGERIKFLEPGQPPQSPIPIGMVLDRRNTIYLTFIVDDLETVLKRLKSAGAELMTGPDAIEVRPGVSILFARDPEQNIIEFVQYDDLEAYRPVFRPSPSTSSGRTEDN